MIKITLACVGKLKEGPLKKMADEYIQRMHTSNFFKLEVLEVKNEEKFLNLEGRKIILDEQGKTKSTDEFFRFIENAAQEDENLIFCIAGQDGFSKNIKKQITKTLSLSPMTFTHDTARVIFLEQLYRITTIKEGKPYHRYGQ